MKLSDFNTLEEAKAATITRGKLIHRNTLNAVLSEADRYTRLKEIAADPTHLLQDKVAAFMDSTEFNFMQDHPTGVRVAEMMNALIAHEKDPALGAVRDELIAMANPTVKPFKDATQYDFMKARGECPTVPVTVVQDTGWLKITITGDVPEPYRPQIHRRISGVLVRVAGFDLIDGPGEYLAQVPRTSVEFHVDDPYGVTS